MRSFFISVLLLSLTACSVATTTNRVPQKSVNSGQKPENQFVFFYQADMKCCLHGCAEGDPPVEVCASSIEEADALMRTVFPGHFIARVPGGATPTDRVNEQVQGFSTDCRPVTLKEKEVLAECSIKRP